MITDWHLLDTGFCTTRESFAYGTGSGMTSCHATCALLRHATRGWLLFDTGYAPRVLTAAGAFPYSLYRLATPLYLREEGAAVHQIIRLGLQAREIRTVVLSHFHADHIGGLRDFPHSKLICSVAAFEAVRGRTGFDAVRRAFLPALMPDDFAARVSYMKSLPTRKVAGLPDAADVFGDGSCLLVSIPGHATGQLGILARTISGDALFFVADAAYSARAVREHVPFHPVTRLFTDSPKDAGDTLSLLHAYHARFPGTLILPTHCPEALA